MAMTSAEAHAAFEALNIAITAPKGMPPLLLAVVREITETLPEPTTDVREQHRLLTAMVQDLCQALLPVAADERRALLVSVAARALHLVHSSHPTPDPEPDRAP